MKKQVLIIISLLLINCKQDKPSENKKISVKTLDSKIVDSTKLKKNYLSFNLKNYNNDSIFALTYPRLQLDLTNKKGDLLDTITHKGSGPGELNDLVAISICDNKIFLIECSNYYRVFIFDKHTHDYIDSVSLQSISDSQSSPYPLISSFYVTKNGDNYVLSFAGASIEYLYEDKKLYQNASAITEHTLDRNFKIIDNADHIPYNSFSSLKESLEANERFWDHPIVQYQKNKKENIIVPFFSDSIFIYNKNWKLKKTIKINSENKKALKIDYKKINVTEKRLKQDFTLRFANRNFYSSEVYKNKLYLIYPNEVDIDKIPKDLNDYNSFYTNPVILIIDLISNNQYKLILPKKVSYFSGFKVIDDNKIIIPSNSMFQDDLYLYEVNY